MLEVEQLYIMRRAMQYHISATLPALEIADKVNSELRENGAVVITAPPGAGKSTIIPLTILDGLRPEGKILMLEPRRIAARQIAERMAEILGEPVGKTVGYRVRFESRVSESTRIEVITEGILTKMIADDATLDGVSVVVFDEFHERSINSDIALALTRESQGIIRQDLKIVVMSATIDASNICEQLHAPLVESKGRLFDVDIRYAEDGEDTDIAAAIARMHRDYEGDILAFLPGQAEIKRCAERLGSSLSPTRVYPLYGNLPHDEQRQAIAPTAKGERKVVLATSIAETSITIEGVRIVVDSGLCRMPVYDARTELTHLETTRISLDMAAQRAGRAGRVADGICLRLWSKVSENTMKERREPEIEHADLSSTMLSIAAFGEPDAESLPWITPPPHASIISASMLLENIGAITPDGSISALGKEIEKFPCHPRMAKMLLCCKSNRMKALACDIAAILEDKDPLANVNDTDITIRIQALRKARGSGNVGRWTAVARIAREYRTIVRAEEDNSGVYPQEAGELIARAYPERVAMATDGIGGYRTANGYAARLEQDDTCAARKWIAIASLNSSMNRTGKVFLAAPLDFSNLMDSDIVIKRDNISWDSKLLRVTAQQEWRIGKLVVSTKPITDTDKESIKKIMCKAAKKDGMSMFAWNDKEVLQLQNRVEAVRRWHPEMNLPDVSAEHLLDNAEEWMPFYIDNGKRVMLSAEETKRINLEDAIWNIIPYDIQQAIERLAPKHIKVPTGSNIRLDYRQGSDAPVLSVRLQECFGMTETPAVDDGRHRVLMELLSPGFKPVQLTQDLEGFWQSTYFEVRKEMRRRYPKHYWPENPLEAEPVRGTKKSIIKS